MEVFIYVILFQLKKKQSITSTNHDFITVPQLFSEEGILLYSG